MIVSRHRPGNVLSGLEADWGENDKKTGKGGGTLTLSDSAVQINMVQRWTLRQTVRTWTQTWDSRLQRSRKSEYLSFGVQMQLGVGEEQSIRDAFAIVSLTRVIRKPYYCARKQVFGIKSAARCPAGWRVCGACQNWSIVENLSSS